MALRWGIVSAGLISNDFVTALKLLPKDEHTITAIAASEKSRADKFAEKFGIPNSYDNYEALGNNPNIDVVYIGHLNTQHFPISKLMLEHGKHVLCEKPLCLNKKEAETLLKFAKEKGLFIMEAVWSRFFPIYKEVAKTINSGLIGDVQQITANFGIVTGSVRTRKKDLGGSIILDIGVYTIQLALLALGGQTPTNITTLGNLNEEGVDESYSCIFKFKDGAIASLAHHRNVQFDNDAYIYGSNGKIKIHSPFWCPTAVTINGETKTYPQPPGDYNYPNSAGLRYEAIEVRRCIQEGLLESETMSHKDSLSLAEIEDELRRQLGVIWPGEVQQNQV